jgi:hypothetical protein
MGTSQGIADLKRALALPASSDSPTSLETTKKQLRRRCEQVYGEKASSAVAAARELLGQDDSAAAETLLKETAPWLELAPTQSQEELRALEAEAAAAKKVIRFRRGSWR